jgi:hypothetical protein
MEFESCVLTDGIKFYNQRAIQIIRNTFWHFYDPPFMNVASFFKYRIEAYFALKGNINKTESIF